MGWTYRECTRRDLIHDLTVGRQTEWMKCLAKYLSGNTMWTVWEDKLNKKRFIGCDLLETYRRDGVQQWGYKSLSESCGPFYFSCPLKYLKMTTPSNLEWRRRVVRNAFQKRKQRIQKREMEEAIECGLLETP